MRPIRTLSLQNDESKTKSERNFRKANLRRYHVQCDSRFVTRNTYENSPFANKS